MTPEAQHVSLVDHTEFYHDYSRVVAYQSPSKSISNISNALILRLQQPMEMRCANSPVFAASFASVFARFDQVLWLGQLL